MSNTLHHFPLYPAKVLVKVMEMAVEEQARTFIKLLVDLIGGEPTGNPIADPMIEEARAYYEKQRTNGGKGGQTTQARRAGSSSGSSSASSSGSSGGSSGGKAIEVKGNIENVFPETKQKKELTSVPDSVDKSSLESEQPEQPHGKEAALSHPEPWMLAAEVCREENQPKTLNTFRKRWREIGDKAFRDELHTFMAELEADPEPPNRGAALNKRLSNLAEALKARKAIRESLDSAKSRTA